MGFWGIWASCQNVVNHLAKSQLWFLMSTGSASACRPPLCLLISYQQLGLACVTPGFG